MSLDIPESDWKIFRQLREIALERFRERGLSEMNYLATEKGQTHHERYLAIYKQLRSRDRELADAFNDARRSTASLQLALICSKKLLTDEEISRFGPKTRKMLDEFAEFRRQHAKPNE